MVLKKLKSITFILFMSIFQPYFDLGLLFQYGPSSTCLNCFILQQTLSLSLLYLAAPLILVYLLFRNIRGYSVPKYAVIGVLFSVISFFKLGIFLFVDRIASYSTYSDSEIWSEALFASFPTLIIQAVVLSVFLNKMNSEKAQVEGVS